MVNRHVIGAHYGTRDWLMQRVTAVVMALYVLLLLALALWHPQVNYETWQALFAENHQTVRGPPRTKCSTSEISSTISRM